MGSMGTWEYLMKQLTWRQLTFVRGMRVLDFGSGEGHTAEHLAGWNSVTAVEPDAQAVRNRAVGNPYTQLTGGVELLADMPDGSFDVILCHNVLEYAAAREAIVRELARLLVPGGTLSVLKHNRPGRVMQMAVLLNRFEEANALLDGADGHAERFGAIRYYEDDDLTRWCPEMHRRAVYGLRTFFDLQQNQEIQKDEQWQEQMLALEERVADMEPYRSAAFLHHVLLTKEEP